MLKLLPFFLFPLLLLKTSCNRLVKMADDSYYEKVDAKSGVDHLKLVFSHNINGETHPCGCRKFPLGGIPQAAGYLHEAGKNSPVIYVDSGDMLFPSPNVPASLNDSIKFTADKLVEAQNMLGLRYFVPGDQDFALGADYLAQVSKTSKFSFLVTNMRDDSSIKHKKWAGFKAGDNEIYLLGIASPSVMSESANAVLTNPKTALKKTIAEIIEERGPLKGKTLVLLSHSGMEYDKIIAREFPELDWIVGSHSQAFLKEPESVGDVKIVQALSRNHYMGEISIPFNIKKDASYRLVPMAEGMEKKLADNPAIAWLSSYKSKLDQIQENEQKRLMERTPHEGEKFKTYISCSSCHKEQTEFWQKTSHSLAWQTLEGAKASNNPQCIGCHSLGFQEPEGFSSSANIVQAEGMDEEKMRKYLDEVKSVFKDVSSVRELSSEKRLELSKTWMKIDEKHNVEHNFSNVQCLHCHNQAMDHPFDIGDSPKQADFSKNCMSCHTGDQSPDWYNKDQNGLATTPNKPYVDEKIKQIACPKM